MAEEPITEATTCRTVLVDDSPAAEDRFSKDLGTGPHQRVADAIGLLVEHSPVGGKVIGLEGRWGAGKSTVVSMLRTRFEGHPRIAVLAFDAWAHEGDPLRRTYLEALVSPLKSRAGNAWIDASRWDKRLEVLARRRKETDTRIIPKTTTLGLCFALAAMVVPLGTAIAATALRNGVTLQLGASPAWQFLAGAALALGPLVVLLFNAGVVVLRRGGKRPWFQREDWIFLSGHALVEQKLETVETPEPTSIEFERHFSDLMAEALDSNADRVILLIIDNLDRVDADSALRLWSTLQTFLQERQYRPSGWFSRLWILVPYDPDGLKRHWSARAGDELGGRELADSFFQKSFQVRFHVPPPVLSSWKSYLSDLLKLALPDHPETDLRNVASIFDRFRREPQAFPTPRELKVFVNQVAAIHLQWRHEFPLEHLAYFVLVFDQHKFMIERLRAGLPDDVRHVLGDDVVESVAGLTFNVTAKVGMELLLGDPIRKALIDADGSALAALEGTHGRGFWAVLTQVASERFPVDDSRRLAAAASACRHSGLFDSTERGDAALVLHRLKQAVGRVAEWPVFAPSDAERLVDLCGLVGDAAFSRGILARARLAASKSDPSRDDEGTPQALVEASYALFNGMHECGQESALPEFLSVPGDEAFWIAAASSCLQADPDGVWWPRLRPGVDGAGIEMGLADRLGGGRWGDQEHAAVLVSHGSGAVRGWTNVVGRLRAQLQAAAGVDANAATYLIKLLSVLRGWKDAAATKLTSELIDGGDLLHHLHGLRKKADMTALCAALYLIEKPGADVPPVVGNSAAGHEVLTKALTKSDLGLDFARHLISQEDLDALWRIIAARPSIDPLIAAAIGHVAASQAAERVLTPAMVVDHWHKLDAGLEGEHRGIFEEVVKAAAQGGLCEFLRTRPEGFVAEQASMYRTIIEFASTGVSELKEWCTDGLRRLSRESWIAELIQGGPCVDLALDLQAPGALQSLSTHYVDALVDLSSRVAQGEVPAESVRAKWQQLLALVPSGGQRAELADQVLVAAISREGKVSVEFWGLFGALIDSGALGRSAETIPRLLVPLIKHRDQSGLAWFADLLDRSEETAAALRSQRDRFDAMAARLRDQVKGESDETVRASLTRIAERLGVRDDEGTDADVPSDEASPQ